MIEHILELIAPHQCLGCNKLGALLCSTCDEGVPQAAYKCYLCDKRLRSERICPSCSIDSPLAALFAAASYDGTARELVQRLKFERAAAAAEPMARLMASSIERRPGMIVVPIPTATSRIRTRGYDQSARIARKLARQLGLPYASLLARTGQQRQVGSDKSLRRKQMQNAFELRGKPHDEHKSILLVDDVLTTGSTIEAAAHLLRKHDYVDIRAAVFAVAE